MFFLHMVRNPSWAADNRTHAETTRNLIPQLQALDAKAQSEVLGNVNREWKTNYSWSEFLTSLAMDPSLTRSTDTENLHHGLRRLPDQAKHHSSRTSWRFLIAPAQASFVTSDNPFFWNSPTDAKMVPPESGLKLELTVRVPIDSAKLLTENNVDPNHPKIVQRVKNAACDAIITPAFTVTEQGVYPISAPLQGYVSKMELQRRAFRK